MSERRGSRLLALITPVFAVLLANDAGADELQLTWQAPAGCPDEASARRAVSELSPEPRKSIPVTVYIHQENADWMAEVVTANGKRVLRGSSCQEVATAAEAIVALTLGPSALEAHVAEAPVDRSEGARPSQASERPASETPSTVAAPTAPPKKEPGPSRIASAKPVGPKRTDTPPDAKDPVVSRTSPWGAAARLLTDVGTLPALTFGASVAARLRVRRAFAELALSALLPRDMTLATMPARGGSIALQSAGLRACAAPPVTRVLFGCIGMEAGRLTGTGTGVDHATPVQALWLAPTAQLLAQLPPSADFKLEAELGIAVPLLRPELGLTGVDQAYRPSGVAVRAGAGIGWR